MVLKDRVPIEELEWGFIWSTHTIDLLYMEAYIHYEFDECL